MLEVFLMIQYSYNGAKRKELTGNLSTNSKKILETDFKC